MSYASVFLMMTLVHIFYLIFRKRKVDFFTVSAMSFYIYNIPYLVGDYSTPATILNLGRPSPIAYCFVLGFSFSFFITNIVFDYKYKGRVCRRVKDSKDHYLDNSQFYLFLFSSISIFLFALSFSMIGLEGFRGIKGSGDSGAAMYFFVLSTWTSMGVAAIAVWKKRYFLLLLPFSILFFHLFVVGSRSWFMIFVVLMVLAFEFRGEKKRLIFRPFVALFGAFVLVFALLFEQVGVYLINFEFNRAIEAIFDPVTYLRLLELRESFIVASHFEFALNADPLGWEYGVHRILSFFPLLPGLWAELHQGISRYSDILIAGHDDVGYGLASNFWAESFHLFGYFGLFLVSIAWLFVIFRFNAVYFLGAPRLHHHFLLPFFVFLAVYIHRVDFTFVSGFLKYMVICYALVSVLKIFLLKLSDSAKTV